MTEMKAEITTAQVLQNELRQTIQSKQKAVHAFYSAKEKSEQAVEIPKKSAKIEPPPVPKFNTIADKDKEAELLKMAKARYQSYADVALFAKELNLRAGVVYLTLKHHGFIRQLATRQIGFFSNESLRRRLILFI